MYIPERTPRNVSPNWTKHADKLLPPCNICVLFLMRESALEKDQHPFRIFRTSHRSGAVKLSVRLVDQTKSSQIQSCQRVRHLVQGIHARVPGGGGKRSGWKQEHPSGTASSGRWWEVAATQTSERNRCGSRPPAKHWTYQALPDLPAQVLRRRKKVYAYMLILWQHFTVKYTKYFC